MELVKTETKEHGAGRYIVAWLALLALTALTCGLSFIELGRWSLPASLCVAIAKGLIVVLLFMHLSEHRGANRLVFGIAIVFLLLLMTLVLSDIATRFPLALPG